MVKIFPTSSAVERSVEPMPLASAFVLCGGDCEVRMDMPKSAIQRMILISVFAIGAFVGYGLLRFPAVLTASPTGGRSLIGVISILLIYANVGWFGPLFTERMSPHILPIGMLGGLLAGGIFAIEMILEYWFLPNDNTAMGLGEYGLVFALFFFVGLWGANQTHAIRNGVVAAVWSAIVGALVWYIAVLLMFYLFQGTPQQVHVFRAEGNYEDFARSGLHDFNVFMMEDFMGAGFFHALLLPTIGALLGMLGAIVGHLLARRRTI